VWYNWEWIRKIKMDVILVLVGLGIVIWALSSLLSPPKKHKDFSLHDRDDATSRALGGGGVPDLSKLEPEEKEQKSKKHKS
jgi:hypothetical protein